MRAIGGKILLVLFGLGVGVVLGEFALRGYGRMVAVFAETGPAKKGGLMQEGGVRWVPRQGFREQRVDLAGRRFVLRINSTHQRGGEVGPRRPGQRRILFLGDSFTMATETREEDTFVRRAADLIGEEIPVEAINGGVNGYGTYHQLPYYRSYGQPLEADLVVLCFFVGNDFRDNMTATRQACQINPVLISGKGRLQGHDEQFIRQVGGKPLLDPLSGEVVPQFAWPWMEKLARKSQLARFAGARYAKLKGWLQGDLGLLDLSHRYYFYEVGFYQGRDDGLFATAEALTMACIGELQQLVEADGAEFAVAILPSLNQVSPEQWHKTLDKLGVAVADIGPVEMEYPNVLVKKYCAARGIALLDMTAAFAAADVPEDLYLTVIDDGHFSLPGHALAGSEIARFLLRQGKSLREPAIDFYHRGKAHLAAGELAEAERVFGAGLSVNAQWVPMHEALAETRERAGRWALASEGYAKALQLGGASATRWQRLAYVRQRQGDWAGAAAAYEQALVLRPDCPPYLDQLQWVYTQAGEAGKAAEAVQRVKEILDGSPRDKIGWLGEYSRLGDRAIIKDRMQEAAQLYERALQIDAGDGEVWNNYGEVLYRTGNLPEAEQAFAQSIAAIPGHPEPYNNLGNVYTAQGRGVEAIEAYEQALDRGAERATAILPNLADAYLQEERFEDAHQAIERMLALEPGLAGHHISMGHLRRRMGQMDASAEAFAHAIALAPDNARAYIELAEMRTEVKDAQGAIVLFREGLRRDDAYARGWYGLACSLDATGAGAEALEAYNTFLSLWPHRDQRYQKVRDRIQRMQGD